MNFGLEMDNSTPQRKAAADGAAAAQKEIVPEILGLIPHKFLKFSPEILNLTVFVVDAHRVGRMHVGDAAVF